MKTYIGTKIINAQPMTRASYNEYRDWVLPANENGDDDGYLVEYTDGGQPNHPDFAGYVSWIPKAQFDGAYLSIGDVSGLPPHQQRVVAEKAELDEKTCKLDSFQQTAMFASLFEAEQLRLFRQSLVMRAYSGILKERIQAFSTPDKATFLDVMAGRGTYEPGPVVTVESLEVSGLRPMMRDGSLADPEKFGAVTMDAAIEQEIQAKGLTAPRVTPADIEGNIASEHYFTAEQGAFAAFSPPSGADIVPPSLSLLTFCVLVLRNGFTVTGESACASPENFDAEIGRKIARANAVEKCWPLMGYALKQQLHESK